MVLSGSDDALGEMDYTISVTYEVFGVFETDATKTDSVDFVWKIKNPCIDPEYTKIIQGTDPEGDQVDNIL